VVVIPYRHAVQVGIQQALHRAVGTDAASDDIWTSTHGLADDEHASELLVLVHVLCMHMALPGMFTSMTAFLSYNAGQL